MSRLLNGTFEIHTSRGIDSIDPTSRRLKDIGLVTIDVENVLAPYGGWTAYPEARSVGERFQNVGINVCLVTNMDDDERARSLGASMGLPVLYKSMPTDRHNSNVGMPSKSHPDIYEEAIERVGFGYAGNRAAHVDDQLKNIKGAMDVPAFTDYFWTIPRGAKSHVGVLAFRPFEVVGGGLLVGTQKTLKFGRSARNMANGQ